MRIISFLFFISSLSLFSQSSVKQGNTAGSEVIADAPYRMKMFDSDSNINPVPLHVFVHESSGFGSNNQLMNITVKVKNAADTSFNYSITFDDYSDSAFQTLFIDGSPYDSELDIQAFAESGAVKDSIFTINFTADNNSFPYTTFVDINKDYWWFTILIPGEKLEGFDPIIDLEVYLELDWATDEKVYLRIFRQESDIPHLGNWTRGDVHYHGMFTQNTAEVGLPLFATKTMAKITGLDWITFTDHSCDFDNYGQGMHQNWARLGNEILSLNAEDSSFVFIRGVEMSVNNSEGKIVHALSYPNPENPLSMNYIGDGGGDLSSTSISINSLCDSLENYEGFAYAAHPFSEGDALSSLVNGSVWNISDADFPENGQPHQYNGNIICNNLSNESDIFSNQENEFLKKNIVGGEIWNLYNKLQTDDNANNPWDVQHTGSGFSQWPLSDNLQVDYRYNQNFEVTLHIWKKGLVKKNAFPETENWKFYLSAGSDAHGSFNYANTDFTFGVVGYVNENAIGKLSTLTYCPNGLGVNGRNVLKALKNGNTVMSSGPIAVFEIDTLNNDSVPEIIIGQNAELDITQIENCNIRFYFSDSEEFGENNDRFVTIVTENEDYTVEIPLGSDTVDYSLSEFLEMAFGIDNIPQNQYFLMYLTMNNYKEYNEYEVYRRSDEVFSSITNPIWLKICTPLNITEERTDSQIFLSPNPARDFVSISSVKGDIFNLKIFDTKGQILFSEKANSGEIVNLQGFNKGLYIMQIETNEGLVVKKLIIQ